MEIKTKIIEIISVLLAIFFITGLLAEPAFAVSSNNQRGFGDWAKASIVSFFNDVKCFFGFECDSESGSGFPTAAETSQPQGGVANPRENIIAIPEENNSGAPIPNGTKTVVVPSQPIPTGNNLSDPGNTGGITQIIQPIREIQTVHTVTNNTNTVVVDEETKDKVDLILRQLDSDRPHFSLGQTFKLPNNLRAQSIDINDGNFTVDKYGNITAKGDFELTGDFTVSGAQTYSGATALGAATAIPLFAIDQTGTGAALRADNLVFKDSEISTDSDDSSIILNPSGSGTVSFHSANNSIDSSGNLVLEGGVTATSLNAGSGAIQTTGAITGMAFNGLTINTTTGTLAVADGKTLTVSNSLELAGADGKTLNIGENNLTFTSAGDTTLTLPLSGTLATLAGTETFTNKTITDPTIQGTVSAGTGLTIPAFTLAGAITGSGQNITNLGAVTGLFFNGLTINTTTGTLAVADGKTFTVSNSLELAGADGKTLDIGENSLAFNTTGDTNVTLPLSGTLATLAGTETFTNKTLTDPTIQGTISAGTGLTIPAFTLAGAITGSGALDFNAGGTDQNVTLTPSGAGYAVLNGNVGIKTTNPEATLDISSGNYDLGTNPTLMLGADIGANTRTDGVRKLGSIAQVSYATGNPPYLVYSGDSNSTYNRVDIGGGFLGYNSATDVLFFTGETVNTLMGTERMRINSAGNIGIGLASPTARLSIKGAASDSSSAALSITNSISTSVLYVRNDGNVGIGTAAPGTVLDVRYDSDTDKEIARFLNTGISSVGRSAYITIGKAASTGNSAVLTYRYDTAATGQLVHLGIYGDTMATGLNVQKGGNVGIGTTTPSGLLQVGNGLLTVLTGGNVGIGTTTPTAKLDISSGDYNTGGILLGADLGATTRTDSTRKYGIISVPHYLNNEERVTIIAGDSLSNRTEINIGGSSVNQNAATLIRFFTAANQITQFGTEQMRINSSGNVGIGITNPTSKLSVSGDISVSNNLLVGSSILMGGKSANAFGDSVTVGVGASDTSTTAYVPLLASATGLTFTNRAESGGMVPDQADNVYGLTVSENTLSLLNLGINDERIYGVNSNKLKVFRDGQAALIAWLAIPSTKKKTAQDSSITYTGTWANTSVYGGIGKNTVGEGTATTTVSGKAVLIAAIRQNGRTSSFDLTIDGVSYGNYSLTPPDTVTSYLGVTYTPYLVTIPNLTNGEHTVLISCHGTGGNPCYFDWIAGTGDKISSTGPTVYVANIIRQTTASYAAHGGSDANVYEYNRVIENNVALLAAMGLNVVKVDAVSALDITTGLTADGIHPNDAGYVQIKNAFLAAMGANIYPRDRQIASNPIPNIKWQPSTFSIWTENGAEWTEKMRIDASGNVGIGITTPLSRLHSKEFGVKAAVSYASYLENIATNTNTDGINKYGAYITSTGNFSGSGGAATENYGLYIDTVSGGDNNYGLAVKTVPTTANSANMYYDSATGIIYYNASSEKFKKDVKLLEYDYSRILSVSSKQWIYTSDNSLGIGFVAEDLEKLGLSELVIYNSAGQPDGIQFNRVAAYMLETMKDQQRDIDALNLAVGATDAFGNASSTSELASGSGLGDWLSNALQSLGMALNNGVASLKEVIVEKITTDNARVKTMEFVDRKTGEIYCTWIENGEWIKVKGTCGMTAVKTPKSQSGSSGSGSGTATSTPEL